MTRIRPTLPQHSGRLFLTDAGLETDMLFNHGQELPEFASHTLLESATGRQKMTDYFRSFLALANEHQAGFVLDTPTWRAQTNWAKALGTDEAGLRQANHEAVRFAAALRDEYAGNAQPVVLNGIVGPCGDGYSPEALITAREAEAYHELQLSWLAETDIGMVSALTMTHASEAIGLVNAAGKVNLPVVVSFTLETNGALPNGQPLGDAIREVDAATGAAAQYFMINCAHPEHFRDTLPDEDWLRRIKGLRCNASRLSHAELDEAEELDAGDPHEMGQLYRQLAERMPWVNVFGGCCGSDLRHMVAIAGALGEQLVEV